VLSHGFADEADGAPGAKLAVGENTATGKVPLAGFEVAVVGSGQRRRPILVAHDRGDLPRCGRPDRLHAGDLGRNRRSIADVDRLAARARSTGAGTLPGPDREEI